MSAAASFGNGKAPAGAAGLPEIDEEAAQLDASGNAAVSGPGKDGGRHDVRRVLAAVPVVVFAVDIAASDQGTRGDKVMSAGLRVGPALRVGQGQLPDLP
jgi:hypothetical protein